MKDLRRPRTGEEPLGGRAISKIALVAINRNYSGKSLLRQVADKCRADHSARTCDHDGHFANHDTFAFRFE
jgi:hypothetical protein